MGASAKAQVKALFIKSAVYQRRNTATNFCLVVAPIFFCGLLAVLQVLSNTLILTQRNNNCGCQCTSCCVPKRVERPWTDDELRRITAGENVTRRYQTVEVCTSLDSGYCEVTPNAECRAYNDSNCSVKFSSPRQAIFCAIPTPSTWPPVLQTPRMSIRAGGTTTQWLPYTGTNLTEAGQVAANLAQAPELPNLQPLLDLLQTDPLTLLSLRPERLVELLVPMLAPGGLVKGGGEAVDLAQMSRLGIRFGSAVRGIYDYYLDNAFVNSNSNTWRLQFLVPDGECELAGISNVTNYVSLPVATMVLRYYTATYPPLRMILNAFNVTPEKLTSSIANSALGDVTAACVGLLPRPANNLTHLNRRLYCGFGKARCDGTFFVREYGGAWDFKQLGPNVLNFTVFYNLSLPLDDPPRIYRNQQLINMAVQAWTKTYYPNLPITYRVRNRLLGLSSFPKLEFDLKLDFSVILGPLFYTWVVQMLMPSLLQQLVYEKEKRLRMMMKMHGLADPVYWLVTYIWYLAVYLVYMIFFVVFGSIIRLKIFTTNSYSIQAILYFIFGNNMIAFMFLLSSLFSSSRTATVVAFLYIFAAGLIGELLLRQLMQENRAYILLVQLIPGFALYRGLMEFSDYSLRALLANTEGMHWSNLHDPGNGMISVWIILLVEWPIFMLLGWYLEQISSTGTGVRRHPLFFLSWMWQKPGVNSSELRTLEASGSGKVVPGLSSAAVLPEPGTKSDVKEPASPPAVPLPGSTGPPVLGTPRPASDGAAGKKPVGEATEGNAGSCGGAATQQSGGAATQQSGGLGPGARGAEHSGTGDAGGLGTGSSPNDGEPAGGAFVVDGSEGRAAVRSGSAGGSAGDSGASGGGTAATATVLAVGCSTPRNDSLRQGAGSRAVSPVGVDNPVRGGSPARTDSPSLAGSSPHGAPCGNGNSSNSAPQAAPADARIVVRPASPPRELKPGREAVIDAPSLGVSAAGLSARRISSSSSSSRLRSVRSGGVGWSGKLGPLGGAGGDASSHGGDGRGGLASDAFDVREEAERVEAFDEERLADTPIIIRRLCKIFSQADKTVGGCGRGWRAWCTGRRRARVAVRTLTLGIQRGECFGLLGPNGAGKTTTINMLTGFLEPSGGDALVEGRSVLSRMPEIYRLMGVCPQENLLWEQLTGEEHLHFYGRLKGLRGKELRKAVEEAIKSVKLHINDAGRRRVGAYSGGMKRRLSVAISFIGNPQVVYLDEPSTGLDPASRRALWDVVRQHKDGRAIILTTHSMEEAEILCDRLGIFVDGQLVCIGNPREITSRYAGYLVFTITVAPGHEKAAQEFVEKMSPNARLTYALGGTFRYELPTADVSLSSVFASMASCKEHLKVLDWGVANATLEEVFIKFARQVGAETREL